MFQHYNRWCFDINIVRFVYKQNKDNVLRDALSHLQIVLKTLKQKLRRNETVFEHEDIACLDLFFRNLRNKT